MATSTSTNTSNGIWDKLLGSVASLKSSKYKTLLLIAGDSNDQTYIINQLNAINNIENENDLLLFSSATVKLEHKSVDIANDFGFGYSYIEFEDENNDLLTHLDIYTIVDDDFANHDADAYSISDYSLQKYYQDIVETFVNKGPVRENLDDLLVVPILNMQHEPHYWLNFLYFWLKSLNEVFDNNEKNIKLIQNFKTNSLNYLTRNSQPNTNEDSNSADPTSNSNNNKKNPTALKNFILKEGECDLPLGFNLLISVINANQITFLEQSSASSFNIEVFEYIQQILRIITLKHGGSLIYLPESHQTTTVHRNKTKIKEGLRLATLVASILEFDIHIPTLVLVDDQASQQQQKKNNTKILTKRPLSSSSSDKNTPASSTISKLLEAKKVIPNLINQQSLLIPQGYDTHGKISTVNEALDIQKVAKQWDVLLRTVEESGQFTYEQKQLFTNYQHLVPSQQLGNGSSNGNDNFNESTFDGNENTSFLDMNAITNANEGKIPTQDISLSLSFSEFLKENYDSGFNASGLKLGTPPQKNNSFFSFKNESTPLSDGKNKINLLDKLTLASASQQQQQQHNPSFSDNAAADRSLSSVNSDDSKKVMDFFQHLKLKNKD